MKSKKLNLFLIVAIATFLIALLLKNIYGEEGDMATIIHLLKAVFIASFVCGIFRRKQNKSQEKE